MIVGGVPEPLPVDHIKERTAGHGVIIDNDVSSPNLIKAIGTFQGTATADSGAMQTLYDSKDIGDNFNTAGQSGKIYLMGEVIDGSALREINLKFTNGSDDPHDLYISGDISSGGTSVSGIMWVEIEFFYVNNATLWVHTKGSIPNNSMPTADFDNGWQLISTGHLLSTGYFFHFEALGANGEQIYLYFAKENFRPFKN